MSKRGKISLHRAPPPRKIKKPRERLALVVKKNAAASKNRPYDVYSVYKEGSSTPYDDATYRKRAVANRAARDEMLAHNTGHAQKRMKV